MLEAVCSSQNEPSEPRPILCLTATVTSFVADNLYIQ